MIKKTILILLAASLLSSVFCSCSMGRKTLSVISGSENKTLEPLIEKFERKNNVNVEMHYKGSVDIMMELKTGQLEYDAVWPANSLWISMGDTHNIIKHEKSIMTTPVVIGIRKSLARELGFIDSEVAVKDILDAIMADKLSFMMTSATQSNSGASAYIGFLYALLGNPDVITSEDLHDPQLKKEIRELLGGINRSSGSSGWLKELFLKGNYDAMVNYEAVIIEANQELVKQGREPLYAVYPHDGLVLADSPLGYVNRGDRDKEEMFLELQDYLLSESTQGKILGYGRRTGIGATVKQADERVFNPDWGIAADKVISQITMPAGSVIEEALNLYQTQFKKPSFTVYCLDYSGSMTYARGERQLKEAMNLILDNEKSQEYLLQSSEDDIIIVIPFSSQVLDVWEARGATVSNLAQLREKISDLSPGGSTDIYSPSITALQILSQQDKLEKYTPAVVLMTDGESNMGSFRELRDYWNGLGLDIPVFSIMFGNADEKQLEQIAKLTRSRVFDGKDDLVSAFKKVRGYN